MRKDYCDSCGVELSNGNQFFGMDAPVERDEKATVRVFISIDWSASSNDEDAVCKYCVLAAIKKLDDRPQALVEGTKPDSTGTAR